MLADQTEFIGSANVRGRLYDFGGYPGARPEDGSITGEIFQLDANGNVLAALDEYEGPEYERARIVVNNIDCWIYWYVGATPGRLISSGDWLNR
jgi:gamma-glutamylcyclotransferase (GGCT)/AIG2-like uncharacterized protein YtfP